VDIVQQPFFYQTTWFWSTVAVGLGLGVLGFYRVRTANLRRRNERLELRIAERTAALADRSAALAERSTQLAKSYEELKQTQQELLETSRLAGIAEMATGVLHNLGNALNSVNTTVSLSADRVQKSKIAALGKVVQLLEEQHGRLAEFFSTDPRGRQLPAYLAQLSSHLSTERADLLRELEALQQNVDHIKEIVAAQQSYAHVSGLTEIVPASELVEYGLRLNEAALQRHGIAVVREFSSAPPVKVERQKVLQILVNLIRNAREAINDSGRPDKRLVVGVRVSAAGRVQFTVTDNGVGIAPENLTRVFAFGYTTKKDGHGFGLHSSANAAKEMGGSLEAQSDGLGQGATLILELPPAG
jgi:C4-dicarboxylate-specific signal transduction histidine kinase